MSETAVDLLKFDSQKQNLEEVKSFQVNVRSFGDAVLSPNEKRLVVGAGSEAIIFDVATQEEIGRLIGHDGYITSVDTNSNGDLVATSAAGGTVRVWEMFPTTQDLIEETKRALFRCLTPQQLNALFLGSNPPSWCIKMQKWPYHTAERLAQTSARK
jgi:WD40 repeat protein